MIISPKQLLKLVKSKKLVEGLSQRELTNPKAPVLICVWEKCIKFPAKHSSVNAPPNCDITLVAAFGKQKSIKIKPGDFFLVKTIEKINLPINLSAVIMPRTTHSARGFSCGPGRFSRDTKENSLLAWKMKGRLRWKLKWEPDLPTFCSTK